MGFVWGVCFGGGRRCVGVKPPLAFNKTGIIMLDYNMNMLLNYNAVFLQACYSENIKINF